jgi:hypothetical protein
LNRIAGVAAYLIQKGVKSKEGGGEGAVTEQEKKWEGARRGRAERATSSSRILISNKNNQEQKT